MNWADKIARAKESRKAGQELRKGKPKVFSQTERPSETEKGTPRGRVHGLDIQRVL